MSIIEILMYSIGSVFFLSALTFTYYSIQCAKIMRGALGRKMMAYGAVLFIVVGVIGAIEAFFFPSSGLVYIQLVVWHIALAALLFGGFLVGKTIQKIYPYSLIKQAFIMRRGIYYLIAFLVLIFVGLPVFILDSLIPLSVGGFSWYSVISIAIWAFCFVNLAIGTRLDYLTAKPSAAAAAAAAAAGGAEIALLRDDIVAVRGYGAITNIFFATAKPALGDKPFRDVLTEYFEYNPLLFEGCKIKDDGTIDTEPIIKNLDRIPTENRVQLLCSAFSTLNTKIMNLYGAVTSPELAKKRLEDSFLSIKKRYGDLPVFFDILRSLPAGILKEERFGLLSREELEVSVRVRTIELEKALEDVKKAKERVEELAKAEKERAEELKDARDVTLSVLEDTDEARRELEKAKIELEKAYKELEKSAEAEAKAAADREKAAVIDAMFDSVIVLDLDGKVTSLNPAYTKMFGWKPEDRIGKSFTEFKSLKAEDIERFMKLLGKLVETGHVEPLETVIRTKDGREIPTSVGYSLIKDADGNPKNIVAVLRDITKIKELEEEKVKAVSATATDKARAEEAEKYTKELKKAYEELKSLDKMKGDFISIAAHELRTPLTPVRAYIEMIKAGKLGKTDWRQIEKLNIAEKNIALLVKLIDDMLDVTRIEAGKLDMRKEKLSIGEVVDMALDRVNLRMGEKRHRISIHIPPDPSPIYGDKELMVKVFDNLLSNAIKYTPSQGKITVEVKGEGKKIHATVTDTGIGIPKKDLEKIFERFYLIDSSLTRKHRGVGLGLAITKGIVEAHNGKIWAESKGLDNGSTFHVLLPTMGKEK